MKEIPSIRCKKCDEVFKPDLETRGAWRCPECSKKNPNLRRHYRSVADLFILSLIVISIMVIYGVMKNGVSFGMIALGCYAILMLATIISLYKSPNPWTNNAAVIMVWTVFGITFAMNFLIPSFLTACWACTALVNGNPVMIEFNPVFIVYPIMLIYLLWLQIQAINCGITETG